MASDDLVAISTACASRGNINVMGVVVDTLPLYRTRGSSACITFTIKDCDFDGPSWLGGLKIKYFNDDDSRLPNVQLNDIVLLRDIKVSEFTTVQQHLKLIQYRSRYIKTSQQELFLNTTEFHGLFFGRNPVLVPVFSWAVVLFLSNRVWRKRTRHNHSWIACLPNETLCNQPRRAVYQRPDSLYISRRLFQPPKLEGCPTF